MKKIPEKIRNKISLSAAIISVVAFIAACICYYASLKTWSIIAFIVSFVSLIVSAIFTPHTKKVVSPAKEEKKAEINEEKPKVEKGEFISDKEWDELEEEEEELDYIDDDLEEP